MPKSHKLFGQIFFLNIIFNFSENNFKSKKYTIYRAIFIRNDKFFFFFLNKINRKYLKISSKKYYYVHI